MQNLNAVVRDLAADRVVTEHVTQLEATVVRVKSNVFTCVCFPAHAHLYLRFLRGRLHYSVAVTPLKRHLQLKVSRSEASHSYLSLWSTVNRASVFHQLEGQECLPGNGAPWPVSDSVEAAGFSFASLDHGCLS